MNDFTTSFTVDRPPEQVYALINHVRSWWDGQIDGPTDVLGEEFRYRSSEVHDTTHKVVELVPGSRIAWLVVAAHLSFTADPGEWKGTTITFDLVPQGKGTEVVFTHHGLVPALQCFAGCSAGWSHFVSGRLRGVLATG
jgi:uncharacterized protein YndB with AHSA1/START domain